MKNDLGSRIKKLFLEGIMAVSLLTPLKSSADLITVYNSAGAQGELSGSGITIQNQEGGLLGWDGVSGGDVRWSSIGPPPGRSTNWLRIYSDQVNQYHAVTNYALAVDNRPSSGEDANQRFPLVLDTQGPDAINSSNNYIQFELHTAIDEGREQYQWDMTLFNGATFSDGTTNKSGLWNLAQDSTFKLPYYNLSDVQGTYGTLNVTPIPEPFTISLLGVGAGSEAVTNEYTLDFGAYGISSGRAFSVESSEDLANWNDLLTNSLSQGSTNYFSATYFTTNDRAYFRIRR